MNLAHNQYRQPASTRQQIPTSPEARPARGPRGSRFRSGLIWLVLAAAGCGTLLLVARCSMVHGWWQPVRVAGGSMAPAFWGPGFDITCDDCGCRFRLGWEYPPADGFAVCPNCGFRENRMDPASVRAGQRVLIDPWPLIWRAPRPWEPIAFYSDEQPARLTFKRVIAGHQGQLSVREGDLFLDGVIVRKELAQLREMRILVHDDQWRPAIDHNLPARWRSLAEPSHWTMTDAGYRRESGHGRAASAIDWLGYDHWVCWPNAVPPSSRPHTAPILDHYGYNHDLSRGPLNLVRDIMVSYSCQTERRGRLVTRLCTGQDEFDCEWRPEQQRWSLFHDRQLVASVEFVPPPEFYFEMAICDQRVLVAVDGVTRLRYLFQPNTGRVGGPDSERATEAGTAASELTARDRGARLAIGAEQMSVELAQLRIHRDVHYLGPGGQPAWDAPSALQPGQWFVLGDNVPISLDSRFGRLVPRPSIVGVVVTPGHRRPNSR